MLTLWNRHPTPTAWKLPACLGCGYALEGLADRGVCPECGGAYDRSRVVLTGVSDGAHGTLANGNWRSVAWFLFGNLWILSLLGGRQVSRFNLMLAGLMVPFTSLQVVWMLLQRLNNPRAGLVELHFDEVGCWQIDNTRPSPRQMKVIGVAYLAYFLVYVALCVATGWAASWAERIPLLILAALAFLFVVAIFSAVRRQPEFTRWLGSRTYRWIDGWEARWDAVNDERQQIRVNRRSWWGFSRVNVVVRCTPQQARAVRALIVRWQGAACRRSKLEEDDLTLRPPVAR